MAARFETLLAMLEERARRQPERVAFLFGEEATTFRQLWADIDQFAGELLERHLQWGQRVILALPNGGAFFTAFYGVQRAGGIPVPIFPDSGGERIGALAGLCGARWVVAGSASGQALSEAETRSELTILPPPMRGGAGGSRQQAECPVVAGDTVAYIQYTSGSTGDPKGVVLTHAMVLANLEQLIAGLGIRQREVFVSWLPVHHDMGLVLKTMVPFYLGARLVLLPARLTQVGRWLAAIERYRATFTAAPDFAYRLATRHGRRHRAIDLSSLRVALNAAEPVRQGTIEAFEATFRLHHVMVPAYGLAEATVGVSASPVGQTVRVDSHGVVTVGRPFPGVEVVLVGDDDVLASPGAIGEIAVRSAACTRGYYRNPRANADLFWRGDFLRTGDLGYLDDTGDLFVVGRRKNIIIHGGRNLAPREIEEIVDPLAGVRLSAAVGIDRGGLEGEQVYVFAEARIARSAPTKAFQALVIAIVGAIHRRLGLRPGRVYLVAPHTLPQTHNGKLRHRALRQAYLSGELRESGKILFPDF
ncbi:MAG: AMP-binding protein [Acidobacteriota bacterium]